MARTLQDWEATAERMFVSFIHQVESLGYSHPTAGAYDEETDTYLTEAAALPGMSAIIKKSEDEPGDPPVKVHHVIFKAKDFRDAGVSLPLGTEGHFMRGQQPLRIRSIKSIPESGLPVIYRMELVEHGR